ncbi:hypothetical protein PS876_04442 [Pseudomonas fluorescens]|jgi:hypothetical protein|uniref:hypothetical protein n=1 Tax=Pseudomonas fluorescens TaxID=294 RepID=UPI0012415F6E|nr:hypothetical protein [Pseudomonas fluorescens]WKV97226.1 hypothetical protein PYV50_00720 [Pseudomonas sp. H22_DOA]VVP33103.1 hypothetical protein PS876_04442 [Pseudomonas fluorescens]
MTAQEKALRPPFLQEAVEGVLYVDHLKEHAHGQVVIDSNASLGDEITLKVWTTTGNTWSGTQQVRTVPTVLEYEIPAGTFTKNMQSEAGATLQYSVKRGTQDLGDSPVTKIRLVK